MLSDKEYTELCYWCNGRALDNVWGWIENTDSIPAHIATFEHRREVFLWVLDRLLRERRLKLAKNGGLLQGTPEELVEMFRKAWPESMLAADRMAFPPDSEYIGSGEGMGLWFLLDACPANAVWVLEDGTLDWA